MDGRCRLYLRALWLHVCLPSIVGAVISNYSPTCANAVCAVPNQDELVKGLLARSDGVFSGRFVYKVQSVALPREDEKTAIIQPMQLSMLGDSWLVRHLDHKSVSFSHNGKGMRLKTNPQPDGTLYPSVRVTAPATLNPYYDVHWAGTIWMKPTTDYVRSHRPTRVQAHGEKVEGQDVYVLEWDVPETELNEAFDSITEPLENGAVLRIFVAPGFGYALPRIEHRGSQGDLGRCYQSSGFRDVGKGIYFPTLCALEICGAGGKPELRTRYEDIEVRLLNEPLPDSEFEREIPRTALIADRRPGSKKDFFLRDAENSAGVEEALAAREERFWTRGRAIGLFVTLAALVTVAAVWIKLSWR